MDQELVSDDLLTTRACIYRVDESGRKVKECLPYRSRDNHGIFVRLLVVPVPDKASHPIGYMAGCACEAIPRPDPFASVLYIQ